MIFIRSLILTAVFCVSTLLAYPLWAAPERPPSVVRAETYLRELDTAQARFIQTAQDGSQLVGTFYLDRPGKLRFEYDDPVEDFIVADGRFIYFYDSELGEQTNAPIGQTLADFILRPDLRLEGDVEVRDVRREGNLLKIKLVQAKDSAAGALILGFEDAPMQLKKWRVVDATGAITEVELFDFQRDMSLDKGLFFYVNPKKRDSYNLNE